MEEIPGAKFAPVAAKIQEQIVSLDLPQGTVLGAEFMGPRGNHEPGLHIFDCYARNGSWLSMTPHEERWDICSQLKVDQCPNIHLVEVRESGFLDYFFELKSQWGNKSLSQAEGIVLKRRSGTLLLSHSGCKKNRSQMKLKFRDARENRF